MYYQWYDTMWPWIGFGGAIVLTILLFGTNYLQSDSTKQKWKDITWMAWLCAVAYLLHNMEEYGRDIYGNLYAFPACFQEIMVDTGSMVPNGFFIGVNIPMFWFVFPFLAVCSKKYPWLAFFMPATLFVNAISHSVTLVGGVGYTPGTLTALFLFFPISIWAGIQFFGKNKYSYKWLLLCLFLQIPACMFLLVPAKLYISGGIDAATLIMLQIINGPVCIGILYLCSKYRQGTWILSKKYKIHNNKEKNTL